MRNLKRVLSLTLASVMLLGMMVIGTSAVDYTDFDDNDNVEAIDVLTAVGVFEGYDDGLFHPDDLVTRAQMAKIMTLLTNLNTYVTGSNPFNDVPSWAETYISACYANSIIKGYGNGSFGSDAVTAVQAAAMLMRALNVKTPDGFTVSTNSTNYVYVVDRELSISNAINTDTALGGNSSTGLEGPILDLGEHLYRGDLPLKKDDIDDFGTPARTWEYMGKEIGTYAKVELLKESYTQKVTGKQLYGGVTIDYNLYVNGVLEYDSTAGTSLNATVSNGVLSIPRTLVGNAYIPGLIGAYDQTDRIRIEITNVVYDSVKIQYVDTTGAIITNRMASGTTESLPTAGGNVVIKWASGDSTSANKPTVGTYSRFTDTKTADGSTTWGSGVWTIGGTNAFTSAVMTANPTDYAGRTFIAPGQNNRMDKVKLKLSAIQDSVRGKRVVLVDDSIVRGTTSGRIVALLREVGAKEALKKYGEDTINAVGATWKQSDVFGYEVNIAKLEQIKAGAGQNPVPLPGLHPRGGDRPGPRSDHRMMEGG